MSINTITLTGRAGRDPEVKYFETGNMVAQVSIAVDRFKRDDDKPDWFEVKLWGKQAQVAADYLRKGSLFGVTGRLEWETWTDRNSGEERKKPVVVADRLQLLGSKRDAESGSQLRDEEVPF
jgi:single-strand DNA-binding protein